MKITESRLRQIIREEVEQLHLPGLEPPKLVDMTMEHLMPTALAQSVHGGYITISRRDVFERWRDEWLRRDPNATVTLQGDIYVVDPDLKRQTDREAQAIVRQKEKYGSY